MVTHNEHQAKQTQRIIKIFDGTLLDDSKNENYK
jgi:ABC-type lipoprotein export system ATPase subunit